MNELRQTMKNEKCWLALPEGLRELMSDISREVLRAQPDNLCGFIAEYLAALLVTRDNLSIGSQVCDYICQCECHPELISELQDIGMDEANAAIAEEVIMKHLKKENIIEANLLAALLSKTNIVASMYPAIVNAVRVAYLRHHAQNAPQFETSTRSLGKEDDVENAVAHTLDLYRNTEPTDGLYGEMATKIQAAYHAYGVRRGNVIPSKLDRPMYFGDVQFAGSSSDPDSENQVDTSHDSNSTNRINAQFQLTSNLKKKRINTASSISLAGSICPLPINRQYKANDIECLSLLEVTEKEHTQFDYTEKSPRVCIVRPDGRRMSSIESKRISFEDSGQNLYIKQTDYTGTDETQEENELQEEFQEELKEEFQGEYQEECHEECQEEYEYEGILEEIIPEEINKFDNVAFGQFDDDDFNDINVKVVNLDDFTDGEFKNGDVTEIATLEVNSGTGDVLDLT